MRSRLLAPGIALCALLADAAGIHGIATWLVLIALPAAAVSAFAALGDALGDDKPWLPAVTATLGLVLIVLASAVREGAPRGAAVPTLALSALVAALVCYAIPALVWVLEPLRTGLRTPRASRA